MTQGGMDRADRHLREEEYLLELATEDELKRVLLPFGRKRVTWDLCMFVLVAYTAVVLPIQIAFDTEDHFPQALTDFEYAVDFIFLFDIYLNFRTAFVEHAMLVVDRKIIRKRYLGQWFAIDLSGSIPLDLVLRIFENDSDTGFVTIIKILKIPKLLRVSRFLKKLDKVEGA